MLPLLIVAAGVVEFGLGLLVLRSFGPRLRLGRLLAATTIIPVAEARAIAAGGPPRYVGVTGRIDSVEEFPDEHDRPLVYRRSRLELRVGRGWRALADEVRAVPFAINEGMETIGIDVGVLGPGLVVLTRESVGTAADARDRVPPGTPTDTPVRLRVEQVSSVEHATALGVPSVGPGGGLRLTAGLGRPLVLSTLERDEAMRVLGEGRRDRAALATALLVGGPAIALIGLASALLGILR